jgi:hypothetical protein
VSLAINETQLTGYQFVSITGDSKCPGVLGGTITLALDDDVSCTINNDDIAPKLKLVKVVIKDNGGTANPDDFKLTVNGSGVLSGVSNTYQANVALAINETQLAGYHFVSITGSTCPAALGGTVTLQPGDDITCSITNDDDKAVPGGGTDQSAVLRDSITISNVRALAQDAGTATVIFRLYSDANCSTQIGSDETRLLTYTGGGTVATAATVNGVLVDPAPSGSSASGTYKWRVTYGGDQFNTGFTTDCGAETTAITFSPK